MAGKLGTRYELTLSADGRSVRAAISEVGAVLRQLSVDGVDLAATFDDDIIAPWFCGAVLVPWPNRVRDGQWVYDGQTLQLDITDPERHTALHGLLVHTAYRLAERAASEITLAAEVVDQAGYPFHLDTRVRYQLVPDGLSTTHTIRNVGDTAAPVAMGAHPFFALGDVPIDACTLTLDAPDHIDVDPRLLPVGSTPVEGTKWDLRDGRLVAELEFDDAWSSPAGSVHTLRAPDGRSVSLCADPDFGFVHVFVTRKFPSSGGFVTAIAIEPMTAQANAFNNGAGLRWLEPGEAWSASWAIRYQG